MLPSVKLWHHSDQFPSKIWKSELQFHAPFLFLAASHDRGHREFISFGFQMKSSFSLLFLPVSFERQPRTTWVKSWRQEWPEIDTWENLNDPLLSFIQLWPWHCPGDYPRLSFGGLHSLGSRSLVSTPVRDRMGDTWRQRCLTTLGHFMLEVSDPFTTERLNCVEAHGGSSRVPLSSACSCCPPTCYCYCTVIHNKCLVILSLL